MMMYATFGSAVRPRPLLDRMAAIQSLTFVSVDIGTA
jgi:hypothetical protein